MTRGSDFGLITGAVQAGKAAMGMAGIGPADITMCQIYDCYTYTVMVTLEDYGFCAKGEGGAFAASGALGPGGSLPVNTGGGQLSSYYMWGFTPLSEAVIQARGDGGARQSAANDLILVSGNGGILAYHGTLVLSPHPRGSVAATQAAARPADAAAAQPAQRDEPAAPDERLILAGPDDVGVVRADPRSGPFFDSAGRDELMLRRCGRCERWLAPTASGCPECGEDADELAWAAASGRGTVVSWSVVHPRPEGPVAVPALVELAEGPWLATGLRLSGPEQLAALRAGQSVEAEFVHPGEGASYPLFRLVGRSG